MHYSGTVYRPPLEANSLLLQVTTGCSHNRCHFCDMYRRSSFGVSPMEDVEADIEEAALRWPNAERVFLLNGDPFVLSADRLMHIADCLHQNLPKVNTITTYARIRNIETKTDAELRRLRDAGYNELNIGLESGLDLALQKMKKGYTAAEAEAQLLRLNKARMDFNLSTIVGCAGADHGKENAEATAALINKVQPALLFTTMLHAGPDAPLYKDLMDGSFQSSTFGELLDEQETLLLNLDVPEMYYFGSHLSNIAPMQGWLPQRKEDMLQNLRWTRKWLSCKLDEVPVRGREGAILND